MAETDASPFANCLEKLKNYVRTRKGTILAAEIKTSLKEWWKKTLYGGKKVIYIWEGMRLISFIIIICYASSMYGGYSAIAICEMVFAIIFFVIFMMELDKQFLVVNWPWSDLFRAGIGALLYLITSLICVIGGSGDGARIAGGVFGLLAGILFGYDAYTIFMGIKSNRQHTAAPTDDTV